MLNAFEHTTLQRHLLQCAKLSATTYVITARAMTNHSMVLILDEPTAKLNDCNATLFASLVNTIANRNATRIIIVSHRTEAGLETKLCTF